MIKKDLDVLVATEPKKGVVLWPAISQDFAAGAVFGANGGFVVVRVLGLPVISFQRLCGARPLLNLHGHQEVRFRTVSSTTHHSTTEFEPWSAPALDDRHSG